MRSKVFIAVLVVTLAGIVFAEVEQSKHRVIKGDTLWDIAGTYYKNPWQWKKIWEANKEVIKNPDLIFPSQSFMIPGIGMVTIAKKTEPVAAEPVIEELAEEDLALEEDLAALEDPLLEEEPPLEIEEPVIEEPVIEEPLMEEEEELLPELDLEEDLALEEELPIEEEVVAEAEALTPEEEIEEPMEELELEMEQEDALLELDEEPLEELTLEPEPVEEAEEALDFMEEEEFAEEIEEEMDIVAEEEPVVEEVAEEELIIEESMVPIEEIRAPEPEAPEIDFSDGDSFIVPANFVFDGKIMKDKGKKLIIAQLDIVYLNVGSNHGINANAKGYVLRKMDTIADPSSGKLLGYLVKKVGMVRVLDVTSDYAATAVVSRSYEPLNIGDFVSMIVN